ncbi:hypothetical protein MC885_008666, partial [Smutsia gigantea]
MDAALLRSQAQAPAPPSEAWPLVTSDEELYDCLDYYYLRDFPACGAGHSKGRTRRERELRTNWPVPGGHERKIAQKLLNGQRKRHQLQLQPRARTRLSRVPVRAAATGQCSGKPRYPKDLIKVYSLTPAVTVVLRGRESMLVNRLVTSLKFTAS